MKRFRLPNFFTYRNPINLYKIFGRTFFLGLISFLVIAAVGLAVKGDSGGLTVYYQTERDGTVGGPFESSGSNSRFALTEAIVENGTIFFSDDQAKFAAPDLVYYNDRYFTIFSPGVSFLAVPFYMLGKLYNLQQLFAFFLNHTLLILNGFLIYKLSRKLNVSLWPSIIAGLTFMFATNALAYSLTFTQHMLSTFVVLLANFIAVYPKIWVRNILFGLVFGLGILADIPNVFMLLPAGIYVGLKNFQVNEVSNKIRFSLKVALVGLIIGFLPMFFIFGWYNTLATGSPTSIGQFIGRSDFPPPQKIQNASNIEELTKSPVSFNFKIWETAFDTRLQLNGFYILLLSDERGWVYYSPVLFIGVLGLILALREKNNNLLPQFLLSTGFIILLIYSMFGDPWGGWGFGPRYMIPAAAAFSVGIGYAIERFNKKIPFHIIFWILLSYSVWVSTIGAMTTNAIPPKVEAIHLSVPISYTYQYNIDFIDQNKSSSLVYNLFFKNIWQVKYFVYVFMSLVLILFLAVYTPIIYGFFRKAKK